MATTYILRFRSVPDRDRFVAEVAAAKREGGVLAPVSLEVGEFLPDVIARGVSDSALRALVALAPQMNVMPDFAHALM